LLNGFEKEGKEKKNISPVIKDASSDTRKETICAISPGLPKRLNCVVDFIYIVVIHMGKICLLYLTLPLL